jgi:type VI secretion system secreted protein VgrG
MTATEELGRLFEFDLELLSEDREIDPDRLLGQNMTVRLDLPSEDTRYFNGFVSRFLHTGMMEVAAGGRELEYAAYRATLRPWLWFLTRTADCRIFQEKTVPEIVKQIFRERGFTDFEEALYGSFRKWTYCVQYRETDFNFVSRLMEQEGIYYYFAHENGHHKLVLCNDVGSHRPVAGYARIPYYPPTHSERRERDHIYEWAFGREVQPGSYALNDFDFERPRANLRTKSRVPRRHALADFEMYDYPGEYTQNGDGETYARLRIEELQAQHEVAYGAGNARGLSVGALFTLEHPPRDDQEREYLVASATHELRSDEYESTRGQLAAEEVYSCKFSAIDSRQPYRAPRITPKPVIQGPQTAIVVGKAGEEIWPDKYGRVKVQFHWDRYGRSDENSSCWVRVAQLWAGKRWGAMYIPRIGQEVIVEFLEGDPDQPIITGRVYNGDAMPPYELPGNASMSTLKSNSTKGGGGFNEIRFEDKKGSEQVFVHGQKDLDVRIGNDRREWIGKDRHLIVKNDRIEKVEAGFHLTVGTDHFEKTGVAWSVDAGKSIDAKAGTKVAMEGGMEVHVKGGMTVVVEAGVQLTLKVGGNFVDISPAGVTIQGTLVMINSGGAPGAGSGCSPGSPKTPDEAGSAQAGQVDKASAGPTAEKKKADGLKAQPVDQAYKDTGYKEGTYKEGSYKEGGYKDGSYEEGGYKEGSDKDVNLSKKEMNDLAWSWGTSNSGPAQGGDGAGTGPAAGGSTEVSPLKKS